jgi:hypothetical protein
MAGTGTILCFYIIVRLIASYIFWDPSAQKVTATAEILDFKQDQGFNQQLGNMIIRNEDKQETREFKM